MCEESIKSRAAELAHRCAHINFYPCPVGNPEFCPISKSLHCNKVTSEDWIPILDYEKKVRDEKQNIADTLKDLCVRESLDEGTCPVKDSRLCPFPEKDCRDITRKDWFEELFPEDCPYEN